MGEGANPGEFEISGELSMEGVRDAWGLVLIEGPYWWREKVLKEGFAVVEESNLKVKPWREVMDAGSKLKSVWVRILDFSMKLWSRFEYERIIEEFGVLLEIDIVTREHLSFKEAKIRIGVCHIDMIPTERKVMFRNEKGERAWRMVRFIIDSPHGKSVTGSKRRRVWIRKPDQKKDTDGAGPSAPPKDQQDQAEGGEDANSDDDLFYEDYMVAMGEEGDSAQEVEVIVDERLLVK